MQRVNKVSNTSYTKKYQDHIPCSFAEKVVYIDGKFSKPVVLYRGKNVVNKFIITILNEYKYFRSVTKKHFYRNFVMTVDNERSFKSSNKCWIWVRLFPEGDNKVGNHDHVTVKYRSFAHKDCSINLRLTKKFL